MEEWQTYADVHIGRVVGRAAPARLRSVPHCVVQESAVRSHFVAEEFRRKFPIMNLESNVDVENRFKD